jgi:hypothetical protein
MHTQNISGGYMKTKKSTANTQLATSSMHDAKSQNGQNGNGGKTRATFIIDKSLNTQLKVFAAIKEMNQGQVIEEALRAYLDDPGWKTEVQAALA